MRLGTMAHKDIAFDLEPHSVECATRKNWGMIIEVKGVVKGE